MKRKFLRTMACAMSVCMLSMSLAGCGSDAGDSSAPESSSPESGSPEDSGTESSESAGDEASESGSSQAEGGEDGAYVNPNGDLYPAYDFGGIELTVLGHNDLGNLDPSVENLEPYQVADRQAKKDYIEKKYNVKLTFVPNPTDVWEDIPDETVKQYIAGTPVADIMNCNYTWVASYVANNMLYDFTDSFAGSDFYIDNYKFWWGGKNYGISRSMGGEGLYYNATMIKELGMEYTPAEMFDRGQWSYDDCYNYLLEMKQLMGEDEYPLFVSPYYWMLFGAAGNGTEIMASSGNLNYCTEPMLECLEFLKKCVENGLQNVPRKPREDGTVGYDNWNYPGETFDKGQTVAISHRAAWQADAVKGVFELGFVPYPWGSNVTIDESQVGNPGAYKTLSDNYMHTYFDGYLTCLTNGIESKADPMQVLSMVTEWIGWDDSLSAYVEPESEEDEIITAPGWLEEDTIDKELYHFVEERQRLELFNPISDVKGLELGMGKNLSEAICEGGSLRSNMESAYNQDMQALIEMKLVPEDVFKPLGSGEDSSSAEGEDSSAEGEDSSAEGEDSAEAEGDGSDDAAE